MPVPFTYPVRAADSNFEPIGIQITRDGALMSDVGVVVKVSVRDRDTAVVVVGDALAQSVGNGVWRYWFTPEQVAAITKDGVWLVQWSLVVGSYLWRAVTPAQMPVRKRIV